MSKYTTEVRFICETYAGLDESVGLSSTSAVIQKALPKIFDFDFPIFDEAYRNVLETKIIRHFYTREIGAETVALWKFWMETRLNEIMPYYNKLYKSELMEFNPLYDVDYTRTHKGSGSESGNGTDVEHTTDDLSKEYNREGHEEGNNSEQGSSQNNSNKWNYFQNTPQGGLEGVTNKEYLTEATNDTDFTSVSNNNSGTNEKDNTESVEETNNRNLNRTLNKTNTLNSTNEYIEIVKGKTSGVSYSKLIDEFRKTLLNIDMLIINNLEDLFFGLW